VSKRSVEKRIARKRELERARRQRARRVKQIRVGVSVTIAAAVVIVALIFAISGNSKKTSATKSPSPSPSASITPTPTGTPCAGPKPPAAHPKTYKAYPKTVIDQSKKYAVTMETSCGTIHMTLDPKLAPKAVNNFVFLAQEKFYDGLIFHRIEENAPFQLVQGGDPKGTGAGTPGYQFVIEKPTASATSPYVRKTATGTSYLKGVIAMANSSQPNTNGSQFFIDVSDVTLSPDYTVLGKADAASLAVLQRMIKVPVIAGPNGGGATMPQPPVYIIKVTVKAI
jgi:peptidyl-prolyl cis-trans isomerase B (cyclophilin B)